MEPQQPSTSKSAKPRELPNSAPVQDPLHRVQDRAISREQHRRTKVRPTWDPTSLIEEVKRSLTEEEQKKASRHQLSRDEERAALFRKFHEGIERRKTLTPIERLKEDGKELQKEIETTDGVVAVLEVSASQRARCRAEDCLYLQAGAPTGKTITTEYRFLADGVKSINFWGRAKHYYHIECFEAMMDVSALIPDKLKMAGNESWGLMVRKWFENKGHINIDKLAAYIKEHNEFLANVEKNAQPPELMWMFGHDKCVESESGKCLVPPPARAEGTPVLKDYVTGEGVTCSLSEVLDHELCDELSSSLWIFGRCVNYFRPEVQDEEEGKHFI